MGFKDAAAKPHYLGHRERLRRRFRDAGADALPDYELLELILFRAVPRRDTKPLAKAILAQFGTFAEALNAPEERLKEVPGLGEAAITEIKLVRAAALRLVARRGAGAACARLLEPGARLLPRLDGLRGQGAVPHPVPTRCSRRAPSITRRSMCARW
jgi:hypothetical protein